MSENQFRGNGMQDAARQGEAVARSAQKAINDAAEAIPSFSDAARATADALRVAGRKASAVISDFTDEARDTGMKTRDQVASRVQAQPMTSILIAGAVGLIVGLFLSSRQ